MLIKINGESVPFTEHYIFPSNPPAPGERYRRLPRPRPARLRIKTVALATLAAPPLAGAVIGCFYEAQLYE